MARIIKTREKSKGLPPGSLVLHDKKTEGKVTIRVTNYSTTNFEEKTVESVDESIADVENTSVITWIDVEGLTDPVVIKSIGEKFGIQALWLEDVLNTDHRPKLEELDDLIFSIIKSVDYNKRKPSMVSTEQLSLFLKDGLVISFQEHPGNVFLSVLERLRKKKGYVRKSKADYLFYALIDSVVDEYFTALEKIGLEVESLEKKIFDRYSDDIYQEISRLKNEIIYLKKSAGPIKDVLQQCVNTDKPEIQKKNKKYFKDSLDHIVQVLDIINSYFEMIESAKDSFRAAQANKMNEIMKVLTIFSALFIPLTFIAGIYGMNFKNIPELNWDFGYSYVWGLMGSVGLVLILYFRKKKWL